ncbi:MAG: hypothetical protein ACREDR_14975 [Blastocatellia bacterium]
MTEVLTALLVVVTCYYAWVTHCILIANERYVRLIDQQVRNQGKNEVFERTFEQVKRLEDRGFRAIRQFVVEGWDGEYPTADQEKDRMIREFSHTMDTIGALYWKGYLDKDLLVDLYGGFIVNGHRKTARFVSYVLEKDGVQRYQEYYKMMAQEIERLYRDRYPTDGWLDRAVDARRD